MAIDLFALPATTWRGREYDSVAIAVDRLSGWMVVTPHQQRGLKAKDIAEDMLHRWWGPFGIPSVVSSDRGPHFAGAWWRTLCAALGIRRAHAQAYHHQANGRAEVAGKTLVNLLQRLHAAEKVNWVEALPRAVQAIHDLPGPSGLSPYAIMYGRERLLPGVPRAPLSMAEDANDFFAKIQETDAKIAKILNDRHASEAEKRNAKRRPHPHYRVGQKVWVIRERDHSSTHKLQPRWVGPCPILRREGASSYVVAIKPGRERAVHADQLKPHWEDEHSDQPLQLHHFRQTPVGEEVDREAAEYDVEDIVAHRVQADGTHEFLTKWTGYPAEESTWEPASSFILRFSAPFKAYCQRKRLKLDLVEHLKASIIMVHGDAPPPSTMEYETTDENVTPAHPDPVQSRTSSWWRRWETRPGTVNPGRGKSFSRQDDTMNKDKSGDESPMATRPPARAGNRKNNTMVANKKWSPVSSWPQTRMETHEAIARSATLCSTEADVTGAP